jgi:hypothetical protein
MLTHTKLLALFTVTCAAACGGSDPGGTGSGTLRVDAAVEASPEIANASTATDFTTGFHVSVTKDGVPVTTGEAVLVSDGGEVSLTWDPTDGNAGRWRGAQAGYFASYELDVTAGDDFVHGVRLDGPDIHVFTSPATTAAVDATQPVVVAWARDDEADSASIETREMNAIAIDDLGTFELPVGALRSKPDETEDELIRVTRTSRIPIDGGVAGSELTVAIENRIELLIAPTGF